MYISDLIPDSLPQTGLLQPHCLVVPDCYNSYTGQADPGNNHQNT